MPVCYPEKVTSSLSHMEVAHHTQFWSGDDEQNNAKINRSENIYGSIIPFLQQI